MEKELRSFSKYSNFSYCSLLLTFKTTSTLWKKCRKIRARIKLLRSPRIQGIISASLCSLTGRYDNPIPTRFLSPLDRYKIPAQLVKDGDNDSNSSMQQSSNIHETNRPNKNVAVARSRQDRDINKPRIRLQSVKTTSETTTTT